MPPLAPRWAGVMSASSRVHAGVVLERIPALFTLVTRRVANLAVPLAVIVSAWYVVPLIPTLTAGQQELLRLAPYLIIAAGVMLSLYFHRGRPLMVLIMFSLFHWGLHDAPAGILSGFDRQGLFHAACILIPVNIALITFMRERSITSPGGRLRIIFFALQATAVFWFNRIQIDSMSHAVTTGSGLSAVLRSGAVTQPALVSGYIALMVTAGIALRRQSPVNTGLLGALAAFLIGCNWLAITPVQTLFLTAGALVLTLGVVRDSYNMAYRDDMTNLLSRRLLEENLGRLGRRYAIAMLDLDNFKIFNDTYGHQTGDQAIRMAAAKLSGVGYGGKDFRYGGEEFTILFPGRSVQEVLPELERLRTTIADYRLVIRTPERPASNQDGALLRGTGQEGERTTVTISIGVAERSDDLVTPQEVLTAADRALYQSKVTGRNRLTAFPW